LFPKGKTVWEGREGVKIIPNGNPYSKGPKIALL
jgi:hypothetical protein